MGEAPIVENDRRYWGGGRLRLMLQSIYIIAFLCLLRFDEVLKIQAHHLEVIDEGQGQIKLTLPFRKTHKTGGAPKFMTSLLTRSQKLSPSTSITTPRSLTLILYMQSYLGFIILALERVTSSVALWQMIG